MAGLETEPVQPRAVGRLSVGAKRRGASTVLGRMHQQGSLKALFPRSRGAHLDVVTLNTAGGITGGDRFRQAFTAEPDTHMVITTQAAERAYRAQAGQTGTVSTTLDAAQGARIDWLPQETILYDRAALRRRLDIRLAADACALIVEPLLLGRAAMGETLGEAALADRIDVSIAGALVFTDRIALAGPVARIMAGRATGRGAGALATVLWIGPDAARHLAPARDALGDLGGASCPHPSVLAIRCLAHDGYALRAALIPLIARLTPAPLPRPWTL
jgi:urease accessory protein